MTNPDFEYWAFSLLENQEDRYSGVKEALEQAYGQGYSLGYRDAIENQIPDIDYDDEEIARLTKDDLYWIDDDERIWNKDIE